MPTRYPVLLALLVSALLWSSQGFSYSKATGISYDLPNERLSGFSQTQRDWWNWDWSECVGYIFNNATEYWECGWIMWHLYNPYVETDVTSPAGAYLNSFAIDPENALTGFNNYLTTLSAGTWTEEGHHFVIEDTYLLNCYGWCDYCTWECVNFASYFASYGINLGTTAAQTKVCTGDASNIDAAGVAFLRAWPTEPWESATSIYCASDPNLPLEYDNFYFSFGGIRASDDPCATYTEAGLANTAGDMHTHPWFSTQGWMEEMSRGGGCGSASGNLITFNNYSSMYAWMITSGAEFSSGDRNTTIAIGKPSYMRVPSGNVIKKLMPDMTESQVWP